MFPRRFAAALLACAIVPAQGATTCVGASTSMGLGAYVGDSATPVDSIGTFALRCTRNGGPQNVAITLGIGPSANTGSIASRQLKQSSGSDMLSYNFYRDALRQSVWGQTPGLDAVTQSFSFPNNATTTATFTIFGRINGLQNVSAGSYGDTLLLTVSY